MNIPGAVVRRLKRRAAVHRRSLNLEVITLLETATQTVPVDAEELIARAQAVRVTPRGGPLTDALLRKLKEHGRP